MEFIQSLQFNVKKIKFQKKMIADTTQFNPQIETVSFNTKQFHEPTHTDNCHLNQNSSLLLSSIESKSYITRLNSIKKIKLQLHFKEETGHTSQTKKEKSKKKKKKIWLVLRKPLIEKDSNCTQQPLSQSPKSFKIPTAQETEQCSKNTILISDQILLDSEIKCEPEPRRSSLSYSATNKRTQYDCISVISKSIHFSVTDTKSLSTHSKLHQTQKQIKQSTNKKHQIVSKMSYFLNSHPTNITIDLFDRHKKQKSKSRSKSKSVKSKSKQQGTVIDQNTDPISEFFNNEVNESIKRAQSKICSYKFVDEYMDKLQVQSHLRGFQMRKEPECKWPLLLVDEVFKKIRSAKTFQNLVARS